MTQTKSTAKQTNKVSNISEKLKKMESPKAPATNLWAIVLAGGDGTRLRELTSRISGDNRPKQFCPLLKGESILSKTRKRLALTIDEQKTLFVLASKHRKFYEPLLGDVPAERLVVQPENRGTAPAIIYAVQRLSLLDRNACAAIFPSDHFIEDEAAFMDYVETAHREIDLHPDSLILLGIEPDMPEIQFGWIEHHPAAGSRTSEVIRFWEKPVPEKALELFEAGALWNSFVMVGRVSTFLALFSRVLPEVYEIFAKNKYAMNSSIEHMLFFDIYKNLRDTDFSRDILQKHPAELRVLPVSNTGWNDLGKLQRALEILDKSDIMPYWLKAA